MSTSFSSAQTGANARVVVLGAGYSGLLAAIRLAGKSRNAQVTLINPRDEFVERVRLHQYAASQNIRRSRLVDILGKSKASFVRGAATAIDLNEKSVRIDDPETGSCAISYDYLVYALGSQTDLDEVPGLGIALGRTDAVGLNTYPYGMPNNFPMLTGRLAASVREFFVHFLAASERLERIHPGMFTWLGAPKHRADAQSQETPVAA